MGRDSEGDISPAQALILQVRMEIEAVLREGHANKEGEMCVQAIFTLLDVLKKFVTDLKDHVARDEGKLCMRTSCMSKADSEPEGFHSIWYRVDLFGLAPGIIASHLQPV